MSWFVYAVSPIDWHWEHLQSVEAVALKIGIEHAALLSQRDEDDDAYYDDGVSVDEFLSDWKAAREAATAKGWKGDFRQSPVVFWIPDETGFRYGFAFKQDNNGTTFIITPVQMHWLERLT